MTREEAIEFIAQSVKSDVNMAKVADAIKALKLIPGNATNGDVMRILFPALAVISDETPMLVRFDPKNANIFNANWWNSPYREDVKDEYSR